MSHRPAGGNLDPEVGISRSRPRAKRYLPVERAPRGPAVRLDGEVMQSRPRALAERLLDWLLIAVLVLGVLLGLYLLTVVMLGLWP
jgi:hypothetical protein